MMRLAALVFAASVCAQAAAAQNAEPQLRPGRLTAAAGAVFAASYPVGDRSATLRRNTAGAPSDFVLLRTESTIDRAVGFEGRVGFALTPAWAVEVGASYASPQLGVTISQDPEAAAGAEVTEELAQYTVDVRAMYQLPLSFGRRMRPYALGGAGYLRQLHEGRLLAESGRTIHVGGGVQVWLRGGSGTARSLGARVEARYVRRTGAIAFDDSARAFPTLNLLAFVGF
jgi:hypothetical protein